MTWTRLSDTFADSPAVLGLSDAAFRCHVVGLVWANKHLQDGLIPASVIRHLTSDPDGVIPELLASKLWTVEGDGFRIAWGDQETATRVDERKTANATRQERHRRHVIGDHSMCDYCAVKKAHAAGDHSTCVERFCSSLIEPDGGLRNALLTPSVAAPPTRARARPIREGEGEGRAVEAAAPFAEASGSASSPAERWMERTELFREVGKR